MPRVKEIPNEKLLCPSKDKLSDYVDYLHTYNSISSDKGLNLELHSSKDLSIKDKNDIFQTVFLQWDRFVNFVNSINGKFNEPLPVDLHFTLFHKSGGSCGGAGGATYRREEGKFLVFADLHWSYQDQTDHEVSHGFMYHWVGGGTLPTLAEGFANFLAYGPCSMDLPSSGDLATEFPKLLTRGRSDTTTMYHWGSVLAWYLYEHLGAEELMRFLRWGNHWDDFDTFIAYVEQQHGRKFPEWQLSLKNYCSTPIDVNHYFRTRRQALGLSIISMRNAALEKFGIDLIANNQRESGDLFGLIQTMAVPEPSSIAYGKGPRKIYWEIEGVTCFLSSEAGFQCNQELSSKQTQQFQRTIAQSLIEMFVYKDNCALPEQGGQLRIHYPERGLYQCPELERRAMKVVCEGYSWHYLVNLAQQTGVADSVLKQLEGDEIRYRYQEILPRKGTSLISSAECTEKRVVLASAWPVKQENPMDPEQFAQIYKENNPGIIQLFTGENNKNNFIYLGFHVSDSTSEMTHLNSPHSNAAWRWSKFIDPREGAQKGIMVGALERLCMKGESLERAQCQPIVMNLLGLKERDYISLIQINSVYSRDIPGYPVDVWVNSTYLARTEDLLFNSINRSPLKEWIEERIKRQYPNFNGDIAGVISKETEAYFIGEHTPFTPRTGMDENRVDLAELMRLIDAREVEGIKRLGGQTRGPWTNVNDYYDNRTPLGGALEAGCNCEIVGVVMSKGGRYDIPQFSHFNKTVQGLYWENEGLCAEQRECVIPPPPLLASRSKRSIPSINNNVISCGDRMAHILSKDWEEEDKRLSIYPLPPTLVKRLGIEAGIGVLSGFTYFAGEKFEHYLERKYGRKDSNGEESKLKLSKRLIVISALLRSSLNAAVSLAHYPVSGPASFLADEGEEAALLPSLGIYFAGNMAFSFLVTLFFRIIAYAKGESNLLKAIQCAFFVYPIAMVMSEDFQNASGQATLGYFSNVASSMLIYKALNYLGDHCGQSNKTTKVEEAVGNDLAEESQAFVQRSLPPVPRRNKQFCFFTAYSTDKDARVEVLPVQSQNQGMRYGNSSV